MRALQSALDADGLIRKMESDLENLIAEAESGVAELSKRRDDRWHPTFHIAPVAGWMNDPNGLSFFNGRYQVYFQHHPLSSTPGLMYWGHVSSPDLITWFHEPIALAPSMEEDRDGVFSGSAVVDANNVLHAYYTGHRWRNGIDGKDDNLEVQMMATSHDGVRFEDKQVIISPPTDMPHFRDPKVWKMGDIWYMILGASSDKNRGEVWLYTSTNMTDWEFHSVLFRDPDPNVFMLECPDLFPLGDKWVLVYGPMGKTPTGYQSRNGHNAGYVVGNWAPGKTFSPLTPYRPVDWGHNFYAPQTFESPDGRRIMFGWMGSFTYVAPYPSEDGWNGQLTLPRELRLNEDMTLTSSPIGEVNQLRVATHDFGALIVPENTSIVLVEDAGPVEIEVAIDSTRSTSERIGLLVHKTPDGSHVFVGYDDLSGRVFLDRRLTGNGDRGYRSAPCSRGEQLELRIFVDNGSVEVYANGGQSVLSSMSFPTSGPRSIEISSESGEIAIDSLKIHRVGTIWEPTN